MFPVNGEYEDGEDEQPQGRVGSDGHGYQGHLEQVQIDLMRVLSLCTERKFRSFELTSV